jgi:hypothetical protein
MWRESGLGKAAFCRELGVKRWQFDYWCRRLEEVAEEAGGFSRVEVTVAPAAGAETAGCGLWLRLDCGLRVEIGRDFDAGVLRRVVAALAGGGGC